MKTYFLPVQSAKKGKQSSPFFGGKAGKPTTYTPGVGAHCVRPLAGQAAEWVAGERSAPLREPQGRAGFSLGLHGLKPG
ncbi:MAG: hypothetical protein LBC37_01745, partial [Zoogloeaceae bacterium]|nr:hypothetical protein [Zoogloeaceae bacterium]